MLLVIAAGIGILALSDVVPLFGRPSRSGGSLTLDDELIQVNPSLTPTPWDYTPTQLSGRALVARHRLSISLTDVDLGILRMGQEAAATIGVRNTGTEPLRITTSTRCGCVKTRMEPESDVLPIGSEALIRVSFQLDNRAGEFRETVSIHSNDESQPIRLVLVHGVVTNGIAVSRDDRNTEPVLPGEAYPITLTLRGSPDVAGWKPTSVQSWPDGDPDRITECIHEVESMPLNGDGGLQCRVRALIAPQGGEGRKRVWVRVKTSLSSAQWPTMLVAYEVYRALRPSLSSVPLGVLGNGDAVEARVRILPANSHVQFSLRDARVLRLGGTDVDPAFQAVCRKDAVGWCVELKYLGNDNTRRRIDALLVVETDRADTRYLEVPVSGLVARKIEGSR
jgi:hypothetical protein